jgi:hypothetical protein
MTDAQSDLVGDRQRVDQSTHLLDQAAHYQPLVLEYCQLALRPTLSDAEQDRMADILHQATEDAVLGFWLEEADHLVAHHLGLIDSNLIKEQQDRFRYLRLWHDLQSRIKVLQAYLHRQGVYRGSIDGVMGPSTQQALREHLKTEPDDLASVQFS